MGAPASLTKWIPDDDRLLRDAVENGASLESLAKGAVCFSRRYTIRELHDRWHSLLYDLDTSSDASARIIEIEIEHSVANTNKTNRTGNTKGKEYSVGKRKRDSVRSHYYAMRKRISNGPRNSTDFLKLSGPRVGTGSGYEDHLQPQNELQCNDFDVGVPTSNYYGHFETGYESVLHDFPERGCDISRNVYQTGNGGPVEDVLPDGTGGNIAEQSFDHAYEQRDFPQVARENLVSLDSCPVAQEFPRSDEAKPVTGFDSANNNHVNLCSGFIEDSRLTPQGPECNGSLQQLGYPSAPAGRTIWRTIEAPQTIPMDPAGCDATACEPKLSDGTLSAGINNSMVTPEDDFMIFTSSYMVFEDGDVLYFMNEDEKDVTNGYLSEPLDEQQDEHLDEHLDAHLDEYLDKNLDEHLEKHLDERLDHISAILMSSPSNAQEDDEPNLSGHRSTEVLDSCYQIPDGVCSSDVNKLCGKRRSGNELDPNVCGPEINVPYTSSGTFPATNPCREFMICTVNTEDTDIPFNDDVFLSAQMPPIPSSDLKQSSWENDPNANIRELSMVKEKQLLVTQPHQSSLRAGSLVLPETGLMPSSDVCRVEAEPLQRYSITEVPRHAGAVIDKTLPLASGTVALQSTAVAVVKEDSKTLLSEKSVQGPEIAKHDTLKIADGCKQETTIKVEFPSHADLVHADMGTSDPVVNVSTSDQEEHSSNNENDVPNFSDIESIILDMDLDPNGEEACLLAKEVSRYQFVDAKKAIIRLEQGANSFINRAISSHGAYAIFYGRRLKYFIKAREVTVGRSTDEVLADIDLTREGPANKISRVQASLNLDEDGTFTLTNLGKFSVFVNGKEVRPKKRTILTSGSVIEIKDMKFMFEVNQKAVRRFIIGRQKAACKEQSTELDWMPS